MDTKITNVRDHVRQLLNECNCLPAVSDYTNVGYPRLFNFKIGKTTNLGTEILDGLISFFYPNYNIVLGEALIRPFQPPEGWLQHPQDARYWYNTYSREVLTEPQLRLRIRQARKAIAAE